MSSRSDSRFDSQGSFEFGTVAFFPFYSKGKLIASTPSEGQCTLITFDQNVGAELG